LEFLLKNQAANFDTIKNSISFLNVLISLRYGYCTPGIAMPIGLGPMF